jgi:steroid 5-alpha reductase family enzyme
MIEVILIALAIALVVNLVLFLFAYQLRSDKLTDISYAISFFEIDLAGLFYAHKRTAFSYFLFALVTVWAFRIGYFLYLRVMKAGKDRRFDKIRQNFTDFGKFWVGQAITAWILMLPVVLAEYKGGKANLLVYIGAIIWLLGFITEFVADYQKFKFKQSNDNSNKWISTGLWRYSRHPNYFGEILIWLGIYVFCFSSLSIVLRVICLGSPVLITLLLVYVSGIPILEKSADKKWGDIKEYKAYKTRTSVLIPRIVSK